MRKKLFFAILIACALLSGCGQQRKHSNQQNKESSQETKPIVHKDSDNVVKKDTENSLSEDEAEKVTEPMNVVADADAATILFELSEAYTGYLDELTGWADCVKFANQDYDGDGAYDRVWMETTDSEEDGRNYQLTLQLSGGEEIATDSYSILCDPIVYSLDMNGDGNREIVVQTYSLTSSAPLFADEIELYQKNNQGYERMVLPFDENNAITLRYKAEKNVLTVMNPQMGFVEPYEQMGELDETWKGYLDLYDGQTENEWVYIAGVKEDGSGDRLLCMCQAFDKWSTQGIVFEMYMNNGAIELTNGTKIENVYELNPSNSPTWDKICMAY